MSLRGVPQLRELIIRYSDLEGSSEGIRRWMHSNLLKFAKENPAIFIRTERQRNKHPTLTGLYKNGNSKTICVRNESVSNINSQLELLRNQIGRKMNSTGYKIPVLSTKPSIQGEWHERMDIVGLPLTITHISK